MEKTQDTKRKQSVRKKSIETHTGPVRRKSSDRRKSSISKDEAKRKGGSLFKPKDSKPHKKPLTAADIRAEENAKALRTLSLNLWRRINAGYVIFRRPSESLAYASFKWRPDLMEMQMEATNRAFMHKTDNFSEYAEALARANLARPRPPRPPPEFIPQKEKQRLKAERMEAKKQAQIKAMIKMGMIKPPKEAKGDAKTKKKGAK